LHSLDELRIAVALLLTGAKIFESTKCCCGKIIDELGLYDLSSTKSADRLTRHSAINFILERLTRINLPSILESVGSTGYGRRPAGFTLGPWYKGLCLVWDATIVETFAWCHYKDNI